MAQCLFLRKDLKCNNQMSKNYKCECPVIDHWDRCQKGLLNDKPIWSWK